jgi:HEAT repeat protein
MRIALLLIAAVACGQPRAKGVTEMAGGLDAEVETQIMLLQSPFGDPPHVRERERAGQWLVTHADRTYQRLLAMVGDATAGPAVVELLPAFGRAESVPALEALLEGPERIAWVAGQALARHSGSEALLALRRAVRGQGADVVIAAADGLAERGDKAACADLAAALGHADQRARYHAVQAAARLACLSRHQLEEIARSDASEDIRALAAEVLGRER